MLFSSLYRIDDEPGVLGSRGEKLDEDEAAGDRDFPTRGSRRRLLVVRGRYRALVSLLCRRRVQRTLWAGLLHTLRRRCFGVVYLLSGFALEEAVSYCWCGCGTSCDVF